jgi:sugar lactone lactonase YvrE
MVTWVAAAGMARAQTAPAITTQPSSRTVNVGAAATFAVVASGTAPAYQWQFNGTAIPGATSASYPIASVAAGQAGGYAVVVSNSAGSVTSNTASLLVYSPDVIRTVAGQVQVPGSADGSGAGASFQSPQGLVSDPSGNIYIADTANHVIRRLSPAGAVTTVAGQAGVPGSADGQGGAASFYVPTGIAIDASGNLYVADTFNSTIRKILPNGTVSTLAGLAPTSSNPSPTNEGSANGTGTAARFNNPRGVAVDGAGNVYVADTGNNLIRKVTPAGVVTTVAGSTTAGYLDGTTTNARFSSPFGIASDANGNLWVADTSNQVIRAITSAGVVTTLAGLANNGTDSGGTGSVARFNQPTGIALDYQGNLFVSEELSSTIREIYPGGVVVTVAGQAGSLGSADGSGANARFFNPVAVAPDYSGNLYIADSDNDTIRVGSAQPATDVSPAISTQPAAQTASSGSTVTFSVVATGSPTPTCQWQQNGVNLAGATAATLTLPAITAADGGSYDVIVTNRDASLTSSTVTLTVLAAPTVPAGNQNATLTAGSSATFSANASGGSLSYQWMFNGAAIAGATGSTYTINPVGTYAAGTYSVKATNSLGTSTGTIGTLTVTASARLLNLSAQGPVSSGEDVLSAGFFTTGGSKAILVRGIGPALAAFDVSGPLADPQLTLTTEAGAVVAESNSGWSADAGTAATLAQIFSQVGAFALAAGSLDQAIYQAALPVSATGYTGIVSGANGTSGQGMVEVYDADIGTPAPRLINLSARAEVGTGASVLTGGFVISGTTSESVLLRGIGPTLSTFGVSGVLAKPVLTLYKSSTSAVLATNSAWGGSALLSAVFTAVGAFPLPAGSSDDAIVTTLAPGSYTVQVKGANSTTGVALVEIYEIPAAQ